MVIPDIMLLEANRVWRTYSGGKCLDVLEGKLVPADGHFPEDWVASTVKATNIGREQFHNEGYSQVQIDGTSYLLKELFERYPREFLGDEHFNKYGANTQFLTKLLDSSIRLHLQAHPTIQFSQKYLNSNSGKTEAYVILSAREEIKNPYVYVGFQHPLSRDDFKNAVERQDIPRMISCFERIPVAPGDVFIVPGGLPHAIGEGILMIEIMEPTDFVVRLEFERGGYLLPEQSRFMGKGIQFALDMITFDGISVGEVRRSLFCAPEPVVAQNQSIRVQPHRFEADSMLFSQ